MVLPARGCAHAQTSPAQDSDDVGCHLGPGARGGEEENGDNLVCFTDRDIATKYAIEAIKLVDHYRFRAAMQSATDAKPLQLAGRSAHWAAPYYQDGSPKSRERTVLVAAP